MAGTRTSDVPPVSNLINPTLKALHSLGGSANTNEIADKVISELNLSSDAATRVYPDSSTPILHQYLASARTILKSNGLIDNTERGTWTLTAKGLGTETVDASRVRAHYRKLRRSRRSNGDEQDATEPDGDEVIGDNPEQWRGDLLTALQSMPPYGFERLCQLILRESGFIEVDVIGRPGDGGIDGKGIIRLEKLISFPISFQCKRYSGNVPARDVRDFRGAMQGRAEKGLFITTGGFTPAAKEEATRDGAPSIDLIDGEGLVDILKGLRLGVKVTERIVEDVELDSGFFDPI